MASDTAAAAAAAALAKATAKAAAAAPVSPALWPGGATYSLESPRLGVSLDELRAFLLEPAHSVDMHPLLVCAKCVVPATPSTAVDAPPGLVTTVNEYEDSMPVLGGLFHSSFKYKGQFFYEASEPTLICFRVQAGMGVQIETEWSLLEWPTDEGAPPASFFKQRTYVKGPALVRGYVAATAREAHEKTLHKMAHRMPYPPPAHVTNAAPA